MLFVCFHCELARAQPTRRPARCCDCESCAVPYGHASWEGCDIKGLEEQDKQHPVHRADGARPNCCSQSADGYTAFVSTQNTAGQHTAGFACARIKFVKLEVKHTFKHHATSHLSPGPPRLVPLASGRTPSGGFAFTLRLRLPD